MEKICQWISGISCESLLKKWHGGGQKRRTSQVKRERWRRLRLCFLWLTALFIVFNPSGGALATSINNQEFFTFHITDILNGIFGWGSSGLEDYYIATGTYEQQLDGDLFGVAEGRNVVIIQVEALQNLVVGVEYQGQEITPNLNRLLEDSGTIYFDHYYQQLGSGNTSDSEFVTNHGYTGTIESYTYQLYEGNVFRGLPVLLKEKGYSSAVFHGFDKTFWNRENIYPVLGFDRFIDSDTLISDGIKEIGGGGINGISDEAFFLQAVRHLKEMPEPYYGFLVTLSSHHPFGLPDDLKGLQLSAGDEGTLFGDYLNSIHYTDHSLGVFLDELKASGMYENTVFAIYGDHFALPLTDNAVKRSVNRFLGYEYKLNHMMNIPLIIHIPGADVKQTNSITAGQVDFLPTLWYLLGHETLDTIYLGQNLLTAESGFVFEQTHLLKGSFISDEVVFEMSRDGVFQNSRAWHRDTGEAVDIFTLEEDSKRARKLVGLSEFYLKSDIIRKVYIEGMSIEEIVSGTVKAREYPREIYRLSRVQLLENSLPWKDVEENETVYFITPLSGDWTDYEKVFYMDLLAFMEEHENTVALVQLDRNAIETLRLLKNDWLDESDTEAMAKRAALVERIIPVLNELDYYTQTEYEGFSDILFMPRWGEYTASQMEDFIANSNPWAVAVPILPTGEEDEGFTQLQKSSAYLFVYRNDGAMPLAKEVPAVGRGGYIQ